MRGYGQNLYQGPTFLDKVICAFSYLTAGMVGFIWIIFAYVTHKSLKSFVKFHAYQSIFISVILYVLNIVFGILINIAKIIPIIGKLVLMVVYWITGMPIVFGFSILNSLMAIFMIYLIFVCFRGEMTDIPFISDNVKRMI